MASSRSTWPLVMDARPFSAFCFKTGYNERQKRVTPGASELLVWGLHRGMDAGLLSAEEKPSPHGHCVAKCI